MRYFTDDTGQAIYLTGSHTWNSRQDIGSTVFDYTGYLNALQGYNHNSARMFVWEQAKGITEQNLTNPNATWTPVIYARTGPGAAADGGLTFDVTQFNQAFFDRLRQRVMEAQSRGIYIAVQLFDGWSVAHKSGGVNPWTYHPFNKNNNINNINGDPNNDEQGYETENLSIPAIISLQEAYVRKVIDSDNDWDNVLYEIANEPDGCQSPNAVGWDNHMVDLVHSYEDTKAKHDRQRYFLTGFDHVV
ncbi:MAG: DUF6298 domain-containing protein [Acidobacteriota bacterium]